MTADSAAGPTPGALLDFIPLAERVVSVDPLSVIRFRAEPGLISGYVRLPYDVIAGRSLGGEAAARYDLTMLAQDFLSWADGTAGGGLPMRRDAHWLSALPPRDGWQRIELIPDSTIRDLVRMGADLATAQAQDRSPATRSGQESLLNSTVLTAQSPTQTVQIPLRAVTALTRMGFLPRNTAAAVDAAPGWIRLAATFGSSFVSHGMDPLGLLGSARG